jgi:phage terminase large subunit-like protein
MTLLDLAALPATDLALAERLAALPGPERAEILGAYDDDQLRALQFDWEFWARPDQLPPGDDWSVWAIVGAGRGAGKTRTGAEWVRRKIRAGPGMGDGVFVGATPADVRDLMVEGPSGILNVAAPAERPDYEPSKRLLIWPNGVKAHCRSGADPESIRGLNLGWAWLDEMAKWRFVKQAWDNLRFALRVGEPQTVITTTPKPLPLLRDILAGKIPRTVVAPKVSTYRNLANLAQSFIEEMRATHEGTRLGRQELHGELLEDVEGALWTHAMIDGPGGVGRWTGQWRETDAGVFAPVLPEMRRVLVGVDPPGSVHTECGIIALGVAGDGRGYVLADYSLKGSPGEWGAAVVRCAHDNDADVIVGERNYGGDMVRHTIATIPADDVYPAGAAFRYKDVQATRGKKLRAEPVVSLSEQHRMVHVGTLPVLEDEMCMWVPDEPGPSPNRVDALVWACTEALVTHPHKAGRGAARQIIDARIG